MNDINDLFKFYNPVAEMLREQQEQLRRAMQPTIMMQNNISNMLASAMQPYINQQNQLREQISSVLQQYVEQQINFREQMSSVATLNLSSALSTFSSNITNCLANLNISAISNSLNQLASLSERIASISNEELPEISSISDEDINLIVDSNLITEDISIEQMYDVLTGHYSEENKYNEINNEDFNKKVDSIDFVNSADSFETFNELLIELRKFNNNRDSSNKLSYKIMDQAKELIAKGSISIAVFIISLYIGYLIGNYEIVQEFLNVIKDFF